MRALLTILRPVLALVLEAFARAFVDYIKARQAIGDAKRAGRAEAVAEAAGEHVAAVERMGEITTPDDAEALAQLRQGVA